jgi:hypothetical protein
VRSFSPRATCGHVPWRWITRIRCGSRIGRHNHLTPMKASMLQDISARALTRQHAPFRPAVAGQPRAAGASSQQRLNLHRSEAEDASTSGTVRQISAVVHNSPQSMGSVEDFSIGRRAALGGLALSMLALSKRPARAFVTPPPG